MAGCGGRAGSCSGEEALLCLTGLSYGRSVEPLKIRNLHVKCDLNDRGCHLFIFLNYYDINQALKIASKLPGN